MFWKHGTILKDCWNFRSWGPRWKTQVTWDIPLKVTSSLLSSAPTPSHDPCFMSAMRWRAHSAVRWTEHLELRAKTKNSSQASSRYSVTGMRKAIQCEHKCYVYMKVFSSNVCSALMTPPRGPRNTAGGDARTPSQENQHRSSVQRRITASLVVRWSQTQTLSPEWPGLFCDKKLGSYAPLQNSAWCLIRPLKRVTHLNCSLLRWL